MFQIHGNDIYISRGDSATLDVSVLNDDRSPYEAQEGDRVVFEARARVCGRPVMTIEAEPGESIVLDGAHTGALKGRYDFSIDLVRADGTRDTIIGAAPNYTPHLFVLEG